VKNINLTVRKISANWEILTLLYNVYMYLSMTRTKRRTLYFLNFNMENNKFNSLSSLESSQLYSGIIILFHETIP
jgi:hypothetical protein